MCFVKTSTPKEMLIGHEQSNLQTYNITTNKNISELKIAMFADSHIGTTFNADGFAKHLKKIQAQNPDIVVVVGDYVDDDTSKEDMISAQVGMVEYYDPFKEWLESCVKEQRK